MPNATIVETTDARSGPTPAHGVVTVDLGAGITDPTTYTVADGGVRANSAVVIGGVGVPTSRDVDELELSNVKVSLGAIVPGISFDLIVEDIDGSADGLFTVPLTRS